VNREDILKSISDTEKHQGIRLDLSKRGVTQLPKKIAQLKNLRILDLSSNQLEGLPDEFTELENLTQLDLSYNELKGLPENFVRLRNLTHLNLSCNKFVEIPEAVFQLRNLSHLHIVSNRLSGIPENIAQIRQLKVLDLSSNKIVRLPGEFEYLRNLSSLNMKDNQLTELPGEISCLKDLTQLNLNFNQLTELPRGIIHLRNLTQLYVMSNQLAELPKGMGQLKNLTQLDMKNNQLSEVNEDITYLENLTFLNLSFNRLIELPKTIARLKNLIYFHAGYNQLISLPKEIGQLQNLFYLDIKCNLLSEIPREIAQLKKLKRLEVEDNPLTFPPVEIVNQGISATMDYLKKMDEGGQTLYEGKLLVVGQGGVGKTCLIRRLIRDEYSDEEPSTEGIDIYPWEISAPKDPNKRVTLNIWDFGGQEIYHATHQFFLTRRSLYLLVWDARQEEEYGRIDYWLKTIETFAEDSPVMLVMNKSDERVKYLNFKELKKRCPQLVVSGRVSAKKGVGVRGLRKLLREQAWKLPLMGTFWPPSWLTVRRTLETDGRYQMLYDDYLKLCEARGIKENEARTLSRYLHDLGIILHFQDDSLLKDTIILKPEWGTDAVYKVLDARSVQQRNGILYESDLKDIWTDQTLYPPDKYATILRLMANFELAFPIGEEKGHIVAELLPVNEAEYGWNPEDCLRFEYHYDFLPAGLITRLIVRMHGFVIQRDGKYLCWREGAYFKYARSEARIKVSLFTKIAAVQIKGPERKEFLAKIRSHFDSLHSTIKKIRFKEKIPCTCTQGCEYRFDYNFLLKCEEKQKKTQTCQVSIEEVNIAELLDGIEKPEVRQARLREKMADSYPKVGKPPEKEPPPENKKWYLRILPLGKK
jgi:internalin A